MFYKLIICLSLISVMFTLNNRLREPLYDYSSTIQNILGRGMYECDPDSYFDTIVSSTEGHQEPNQCNSFKVKKRDEMIYGLKKGRYIPLNSNGFYALLDNNGSEHFIRIGAIIGGECDNSPIFLQNIMVVSNGSCTQRDGVTQLHSVSANYVIQGKCSSSCTGEASVDYWPGKTNIPSN